MPNPKVPQLRRGFVNLLPGPVCALLLFSAARAGGDPQSGDSTETVLTVPLPKINITNVRVADRDLYIASAEGVAPSMEPGRPPVPTKRVLVDVPRDAEVSLDRVDAAGETTILMLHADVSPKFVRAESVRPPGAGDPNEMIAIDAAPIAGEFPESWAKIEYIGDYGGRHVACVLVACARVDAAHRIARTADSLTIHLTSQIHRPKTAASQPSHNPGPHQPPPPPPPPSHAPYAHTGLVINTTTGPAAFPQVIWQLKIEVNQRGIYAIKQSDLAAAGIALSSILPKRLVVYNDGRLIPIAVEGEADGVFDAADRVLFYGIPMTGPYTHNNAYFLTQLANDADVVYGNAARFTEIDAAPKGYPSAPYFRETGHYEQSLYYWQFMPNGEGKDHWFWNKTIAPSNNSYPAGINDPSIPGSGSVKVRAQLYGYTDTVQNPDHHTKVRINNTLISDVTWNGITSMLHESTVNPSLLIGGTNTIGVEQAADTGSIVDGIYTDWLEIEYDRQFNVVGDELYFKYATNANVNFTIRKLQNNKPYILDVTDTGHVMKLINGSIAGTGPFTDQFSVTGTGTAGDSAAFYVATQTAFRTPVSIHNPAPRMAEPAAGADLIVIAPTSYNSALAPLVQRRISQGLRVFVTSPDVIYDQFGAGIAVPQSIKTFLTHAYLGWTAPAPRYLLLVGDASIDPFNFFGVGIQTQIPVPVHQVIADGEIPTDHDYACLVGNDALPELVVGRIPAANASEVTIAVNKILNHEQSPPAGAWKTTVSHFADHGIEFTSTLDTLGTTHVPPGYSIHKVYADNYASSGLMHTATVAEVNAGEALVTYLGHGSAFNWGNYLNTADAAVLTNGTKTSFVTTLNCTNGYIATPTAQHSMAEALLFSPNGAIGCYASAGLGFLTQLTPIASYAYDRLFAGQLQGDVTTGAKVDAYLIAGVTEDNLWLSLLIGDPTGGVLP
ncbi:MAG: hypothetical protein HY286_16400 [Planctomycetes bacterium]|nr:hypothetical protein [Planctomycetota bacterium]